MNEIAKTTADVACKNEATASKAIGLLGEVLDATHDVTGPQAAMIVGTAAVIVIGACCVFDGIFSLIKGNCIKDVDFENKKVTFNNSVPTAAA